MLRRDWFPPTGGLVRAAAGGSAGKAELERFTVPDDGFFLFSERILAASTEGNGAVVVGVMEDCDDAHGVLCPDAEEAALAVENAGGRKVFPGVAELDAGAGPGGGRWRTGKRLTGLEDDGPAAPGTVDNDEDAARATRSQTWPLLRLDVVWCLTFRTRPLATPA